MGFENSYTEKRGYSGWGAIRKMVGIPEGETKTIWKTQECAESRMKSGNVEETS